MRLVSINSALVEWRALGLKNSRVCEDWFAIQGIGCSWSIEVELRIRSLLCLLNSVGLSQRWHKAANWCPIEWHYCWLILWTVGVYEQLLSCLVAILSTEEQLSMMIYVDCGVSQRQYPSVYMVRQWMQSLQVVVLLVEVENCCWSQSTVDREVVRLYGSGSKLEWKIAMLSVRLYTDQSLVYWEIFYWDR